MAFEGKRFGTRVARRLVTSFVLASLVPVGAFAFFTAVETHRTLEARAESELRQASIGFGELLAERLHAAGSVLEGSSVGAPFDSAAFDAVVYRATPGTHTVDGALLDPADVGVVEADHTRLVVETRADGIEIVLERATGGRVAVGTVAADYLWRSAGLLPDGTNMCVFSADAAKPLYCSEALPDGVHQSLVARRGAASSETVAWYDGDTAITAVQAKVPLPAQLAASPWFVTVSRPAPTALASLAAFRNTLPRTAAVSLVVILLLAFAQNRRIVRPLSRLMAGTRRIAAREFATRVELGGGDEFQELGNAMNAMAQQLGRQFETLTALQDIDGLMLASGQSEETLDAVLARVARSVEGRDIAVLLIEADDPNHARLHRRNTRAGAERSPTRCAVSQDLRQWLGQRVHSSLEPAADVTSRLPAFVSPDERSRVFVMPLVHDEHLRGALFATFEPDAVAADAELDSLREIGNRVVVAISTAEREQQLFQKAHFDALTGLPNRQLCHDRLRQALAVARRQEQKLAVLFIDLDGFKTVNDSLGHEAGDQLLREASVRLRSATRETDTVARLGGDEYVVILPSVHGPLEVEVLVASLMEALKWPFHIDGEQCFIGASIGVTMFPEDGATAEDLLRKADTAMYSAKEGGRARYVFFAKEMDDRVHDRRMLQSDLRSALANRELFLVYQPQVDLASGEVVCAEALLRWRHPTRGLIAPAIILPVLEETGLVESIGRWALRTALEELSRWKQQGLSIARVAVNVTTRQLFDPGFVNLVDECLQSTKLPGSCLEIELTEGSLVTDFARADKVLGALAARGIGTSIDDFGTGYSSLGYLKELSFDRVKIDRAFIEGLPDAKSLAIVKAVLGIARSLHKEVVAEGIESEMQRRILMTLKCEVGQGFLFSRPMLGPEFSEWLGQVEGNRLFRQVFASSA